MTQAPPTTQEPIHPPTDGEQAPASAKPQGTWAAIVVILFWVACVWAGMTYLGPVGQIVILVMVVGLIVLGLIPATRPIALTPFVPILAPVVLSQFRLTEVTVKPVDGLTSDAPDLLKATFQTGIDRFSQAKLVPRGMWRVQVSDTIYGIVAGFDVPGRPMVALVVAHLMVPKTPPQQRARMTLASIGPDGEESVTRNEYVSSVLAPEKGRVIYVPGSTDVRELIRVHTTMVNRVGGVVKHPVKTDMESYLAETQKAELARLVRDGWFRPAPQPGVIRPAWKAVIRATVMSIWPVEPLMKAAAFRRSRQWRRELGV